MDFLKIFKSVVVTEKSSMLGDSGNKVLFYVDVRARKNEISSAIEKFFAPARVKKINSLIERGKTKSFRGTKGKKTDRKKIIVTLAEGVVDFSNMETH